MKLSGRFQVAALLAAGFMALLLLGGGLAACASGATSASASPPTYTESDEPESRKRATNRLKLAVLYFQDAKLNFALDEVKQAIVNDPNWFEPYGIHTNGRAYNVSFLYGHIKYPVIAEFISKSSCFTEYTAKPLAYVLAVKQGFRMVL